MDTTTTDELLARAKRLMADLEGLRVCLEGARYRPEVKSALSRDLRDSEARVTAVIEACQAPRT